MVSRPAKRTVPARDDAAAPVRTVEVDRIVETRRTSGFDSAAREEPLEIQIGPMSLAVVMRTPGHDLELAMGFLLTERIIRSVADVESIRHCSRATEPASEDNVVRVTLAPGVSVDVERLRRNLYASSSCGICGKATIDQALAEAPPLNDALRVERRFFHELPARLRAEQTVFEETGGLHAAGLFTADGRLRAVREDVGRHNAVDKVVGWAARDGAFPLAAHVLFVSGRISYEIAQKALAARVPVVAAVSAPTSLAVELAERANLTLVAFVRGRSMNVYGAKERVA